MRGRVGFIERADRPDRIERRQIEVAWTRALLAAHPALEIPDEVPLVQKVGWALELAHALTNLEVGETDATARRLGGGWSPYSPASFKARLPPSE